MPVAYNSREDVLTAINEANQRIVTATQTIRSERDFIRVLRTEVLPMYPRRKKLPALPPASQTTSAIGALVKLIRQRTGETRGQFALRLGVRQSIVSRYEVGGLSPARSVEMLLFSLAVTAAERVAVTAILAARQIRPIGGE